MRSVSAIPNANSKMFDDSGPAKSGVLSRIDDAPTTANDEDGSRNRDTDTGENWLSMVKSRAEVALKVFIYLEF